LNKVSATTLATFEIFEGLPMQDREAIADMMSLRQYKAGTTLISADEDRSEVFFLMSGRVRAYANSREGKQVQFEELSSGSMFGELSAVDGNPRGNDCVAVTEVGTAVITSDAFLEIMHQHPTVMKAVLTRLTCLVRKHLQRIYEFSTESAGSRVRLEILRMIKDAHDDDKGEPLRFQKVPTHADIASRISTHREAVTRELKSLERMGLIDWRPGNYVVHDIAAFEALALNRS